MINIEKFQAGHYEQGVGYKYFVPNKINDEWCWNTPIINNLLEKAAIKLGELNSFSRLVPNIDLFIKLHVAKEAVVSSRIEGTQTQMDEALLPEEEVRPERRDDWKEVNNYIDAIDQAIVELEKLPISSRLIKATHKLLLDSVRGEHKLPGTYRSSQNWIGGNSIADAKFIPPHFELLGDLMGDLETFLNNDNIEVPALIKIAVAHYQFETIHPFLDGNGRIGRLLITLFLVEQKILDKPLLYISSYFEKNKELYYDNLHNTRVKNDMLQWIKYFLVGIEQTATLAVRTLSEIIQLKTKIEENIRLNYGRRSNVALVLLHHLLKKPFVTIEDVAKACDLSYKAANDLVKKVCEDKYLVEMTGQSRNRIFVFGQYLDLFK
ncbi:Fic family protein [Bacteroides heparinolyticus]|uniref:Fic family protein n=1 Tax=Prevotella heparinolytica TaxID=28113 RepID=UPI00359F7817